MRRSCSRRAVLDERCEQLGMAIEPGAEREALDRTLSGDGGVAIAVRDHAPNSGSECLGRRRLVPGPALRVRDADARLVADELDRPTARGVHDREPARHCLDHEARARVEHFRVQEQVCTPEERRCVRLRIPSCELHAIGDSEPPQQRLWVRNEPAGDDQMHIRHVRERPQRHLEPVRLRLIAAEQ